MSILKDAADWLLEMGKKIGDAIDDLNERTGSRSGWSDRTIDINETVKEVMEKEKEDLKESSYEHADFLYFDTWLTKMTKDQAGSLTDVLLNIPTSRSVTPLDYGEYLTYPHRSTAAIDLNSFLRLGDCVFQIPPSFIEVIDQSDTQRIGSIRQNGSVQANQGFANREIVIHLFFNGIEQINGYSVEGPDYQKEHFVDGLRPLMSQFRATPFLPIENILLNQTFNIHAVALSSINVQTVEGFPETLEATLNLIEFDAEPYTNIENSMFTHMIDWDLFRYNYQRFLIHKEAPRYLPKVTDLEASYRTFSLYSLNIESIIKEKDEDVGDLYDKRKYKKFLSDDDHIHLTAIQFGLSNLIPSTQMEGYGAPVIQYLGNTDATVSLTFETTNLEAISQIDDMVRQYRLSVHSLKRYNKVGFLMIENELTALTGSKHFVLNTFDTATVPEFPGLYRIAMNLTSYNVEPFDGTEGSTDGELYGTRPFNRMGTKEDAIDSDLGGLHRKVLQDNYVEKMMAEKLKLYPDLELPTVSKVNTVIKSIIRFRKEHGLTKYPLNFYPVDCYQEPGSARSVEGSGRVDPDYYVFYPVRYADMKELSKVTVTTDHSKASPLTIPKVSLGEAYTIDARMAVIDNAATKQYFGAVPTGTGGFAGPSVDPTIQTGNLSREAFVNLAKSMIGCGYKLGSLGEYIGGKRYFDCTSLIAWCFWQFGEWGGSSTSYGTKPTSKQYPTSNFMFQIPIHEAQAGDLAWRSGHAGIITGKPLARGVWETVEAMDEDRGVRLGQFNGYANPFTHVFRPYAFNSKSPARTRSVESVNATGITVQTKTEKEIQLEETGGSSGKIQIRTDMRFDSYVTAAVLNKHLIKGLTGKGPMLVAVCQKHNVDPALVAAITKLETGHGTSSFFLNYNNPGGLMDPKTGSKTPLKFATLEAGYERMVSNLAKNYIDIGLNTIPKIGAKYCPVGAANDPNGTNSHWVPTVTDFYKKIKATAYDVATGAIVLPDAGTYTPTGSSGVATIEVQPAIPAYGRIAITTPYEWQQAQAGQTLQGKVVKYSVKNGVNTRTVYTKTIEGDPEEKQQMRANINIQEGGTSPNRKPYLSSEKEEVNLYGGPNVKTNQAKVKYHQPYFGHPLVIKTPVLRMLEKAGIYENWVPSVYFNDKTFEGEAYPYENAKKKYGLGKKSTDDQSDAFRWFERSLIEEMTGENMFNYMCVDMVQGNSRGRLCRAFPTFVFAIVDASGEWLDGRKLWSNYYFYRSVMDIKVFQESEQPIHTAQITVSNTFDRLGKAPTLNKQLYDETKIENDPEYKWQHWWYKKTGSLIGTPKLTSNKAKLKSQIWDTIDVREGCRIHIRMGYGSNPSRLTTTFNGVIAEIEEYGEQLRFIAQSDGAELLNQVLSNSDTETNGMFKFQCETSNIIANILSERMNKITNAIYEGWGEPSKYGIESFGLPLGKIGFLPTAVQDQLDLTKNVYLGRYKPYLFTEELSLFGRDGEKNFKFRLGGKYAWDVFQQCAQILPEFVCQPVYHQFESRIFYGLPYFPLRYRYDIKDEKRLDTWTESCKTFAQFHLISSSQDIISNKMKASKRNFSPNAIGLYTSGSSSKKTPVLYSDRTMDWSKQSTKVYDTTIVRRSKLADKGADFLGLETGKTQAINICKSNLLEQWKQTYKGEVIILGDSTIKPLDYIYMDDTTKEIKGITTVRSVVHSLNSDTGFTTSYVPGLIALDTEGRAGTLNLAKSMIMLGGLSTSVVNAVKLGNQWAKAGKALSGANLINWMAREVATPGTVKQLKKATTYVWNSVKSGSFMLGEAKAFNSAKNLFSTSAAGIKLKKGVNTVKNVKAFKTAFAAGKTAVLAASNTVAPIIGPLVVSVVTQIAVNTVLDAILDYLAYKNCVKIIPVYKNGRPFCIATTGAQHLILGSSSNAIENSDVDYDVEDDEEIDA